MPLRHLRTVVKTHVGSFILVWPHLATYILYPFMNKPGLGTRIDSGMALTPFPSNVG